MEGLEIHISGRQTVNPQEMISLKGEINYPTVNFQDGKNKVMVATTIKKIQEHHQTFPNFFRVSKSTFINLNCIYRVKKIISI